MRFIFVDTETTSDDESAAVCEIGWIETDEHFNEVARIESLIDPQKPIEPSASGVHGIVDEDVQHCPTLDEFFREKDQRCFGSLLDGEVVAIGHNVQFDTRFVKPYIPNLAHEVCTLRWSRKLYPDSKNHRLSTMKYLVNLPRNNGDSHRVMVDVEDALNLTKHICAMTGMNLKELVAASAEPMLVERMAFGKHKGMLMQDVPRSYLQWMAREMQLDKDMAHTVAYYLAKR